MDNRERALREALAPATELKIRLFLWQGHGHPGIYGDDGEMQCGECAKFGVIDYKRESLDKVVEAARLAALERGLAALAQLSAGEGCAQEHERP